MSFLKKYRFLALGGGVLGLAVLTKGPTAYLIAMLVIVLYWARYKFRGKGYFLHFVILSAHALLAALLWFGVETFMNGTWFVTEFIQYQIRLFATPDSGHGGFLGYHFVVLLFGCFPFSVLALPNLWGMKDDSEDELLESDTLTSCKRSDFGTWMQLLFWVVLILFSVVKTKILHYSSLAYFPLTYLGALTLWRAIRWGVYPRIVSFMLIPVGFLLGTLVAAIPLAGMNIDAIRPLFSKDPFALGNLDASVAWSFTDMIPGLILIAASLGAGVFWIRKNAWQAGQVLLAGGAVFTSFTLVLLVPNIEGYSQRAAIEFYESHCGEKCFIKPVGFKSYAHLFYSCKQNPGADKRADDYDRLTFGTQDRNVYFVAKVERLGELPGLPGCHEIGRRNGFVFFEKLPELPTPSSHD
jgi:4-amino-4-deoxy-L-arabinose transferase-like glycosyltransferase